MRPRIALQFAIRQELAPLARRMRPRCTGENVELGLPSLLGEIGGVTVLAVAGGMGQRLAGKSATALLEQWRPDLLIMAGVAGALHPELQVGEVVLAQEIHQEGETLIPSSVLTNAGSATRTGAFLSLDRVLVTAQEKRQAVSAHSSSDAAALAVEMETAAVARAAAGAGVPWAAVRAISDTAEEGLPLDFNALRDEAGDLPTSRVALAAMRNPRAIPGLIRLGQNTSLAAERLATYLTQWLEVGPSLPETLSHRR